MANRRPRKKPRVNRKRLQTQGFAVPPKVVALVSAASMAAIPPLAGCVSKATDECVSSQSAGLLWSVIRRRFVSLGVQGADLGHGDRRLADHDPGTLHQARWLLAPGPVDEGSSGGSPVLHHELVPVSLDRRVEGGHAPILDRHVSGGVTPQLDPPALRVIFGAQHGKGVGAPSRC